MIKQTVAVLITAALAGCAGAPAKKPSPLKARCNEDPQWVTQTEVGERLGIFICFGEENRLLYTTKVLAPLAPVKALAKPQPSIKKPAAKKLLALPTLGGTAADTKK